MKKKSAIAFILAMSIIYLAVFGFYMANREIVGLPQTVDTQIVKVSEAELVDGQASKRVTLPTYVDANDEVRLQFILDYNFSGETHPSLILQANHTFMTILLDGEEIYKVEPQAYSLGNYFTDIPMPQSASEALLEIRVTIPEKGHSRIQVPELTIADEAVFVKQQILRDVLPMMINLLILLCGIVLFAFAIVGRKSINPYKMLLRGFLAVNCAVYFMCETFSVVLMSQVARTVYITDMLSFAMLAPPLLVLLAWEMDDWRGKLLKSIAGVGMAGVAIQLAISMIGGVELRQLLPMTHAVQILGILAMVVCITYGAFRKKGNSGLYLGAVIALGGAMDLVFFMLEIGENNVFFAKIAILVYLIHQMYQFVQLLRERSADEARESYYKTLALQDPLSRCYSRAAFELDRGAWDGKTARTVFFLDLNALKAANDRFGHSAGDQLIRALGGVLNSVFISVGKCYRVGGDEFWVVCDGLDQGQAAEMTAAAQHTTDVFNRDSNLPTELSYAVGVCDTEETRGDLNRAIELADARMYENKRQTKRTIKKM